jgi:hypothetical protein
MNRPGAPDLVEPEPVVADYTTRVGAERLALAVRRYWAGLGYDQVRRLGRTHALGGMGRPIKPVERSTAGGLLRR